MPSVVPQDSERPRFFLKEGEGDPFAVAQIFDDETKTTLVRLWTSTAIAMALVTALNADHDLANRIVDCSSRLRRQRDLAYASLKENPVSLRRTPESLALDPLNVECLDLLREAIGEERYEAFEEEQAQREFVQAMT